METINYSMTIKDKFNINKLKISVKDSVSVNDLLYVKSYPEESKVRFFPIINSDISELDKCVGIDNLNKDEFLSTFIINDNLFIIERRGEKVEV